MRENNEHLDFHAAFTLGKQLPVTLASSDTLRDGDPKDKLGCMYTEACRRPLGQRRRWVSNIEMLFA